jgi:hypothetical protein
MKWDELGALRPFFHRDQISFFFIKALAPATTNLMTLPGSPKQFCTKEIRFPIF